MLTSKKSDISPGTSQVLAFLTNMLDWTKTKKKELESIGGNIFKISLQNYANLLIAIANTAGNSVANDMLIDKLNELLRETYDKYPNADTMGDLILDAFEIFNIAYGKHSQSKETFYDNALEKAFKGISFQQYPKFIQYDSYMKKKKKTSNIIPYEDE